MQIITLLSVSNYSRRKHMDVQDYESAVKYLKTQQESIEESIVTIRRRLRDCPDGLLRVEKKGDKYQYYQRTEPDEVRGKYITRKNHALAVALAQKSYDIKLLDALDFQYGVIYDFLISFDPNTIKNVYSKLSEPRKELVDKSFTTDEEFAAQWLAVPYKKLGFKTDAPEFYTLRGERVRSKSEILIADALYRNNIPYRYEYPVYEDGVLLGVPDFNCLNVRLRKDYYWEHLGMLGDENYANKNVQKLERYTLSQDFDESSLILTMESAKHPLNTRVIEAKIRKYLL